MTVEEILKGAIDMHSHSCPEFSANCVSTRLTDIESLNMAKRFGMRGIVLKAHTLPTIGKAQILRQVVDGVDVYGSITLNRLCGGIDPVTVELACKLGCSVIHMPTYSAKYDLEHHLAIDLLTDNNESAKALTPEKDGITIFEDDGVTVRPAVIRCLEIARDFDVCMFTGHLSPEEGLRLCELARELDYHKMVYCHPTTVFATTEQMEKAIELGAYVEFTCISMMPVYEGMRSLDYIKIVTDLIRKCGSEHIILTSDHFDAFCPPAPEMMRMWVSILKKNHVPDEDLHRMVTTNQWKLLGLEA